MSYVGQNSSEAVPWRSFLTRSGSFTPGSSTRMRPLFPSFWMLGCVTPKRSIRFLNTLNEFAIALSASLLITSMTCASEDSGPILPTMSKVPNTCASGMPFEVSFHASAKSVMKSSLESTLRCLARAIALVNSGVELWFERAFTRSSS